MKETFYFSHDYGARNDEKIMRLLAKEGLAGYGAYWAIVESLYEADGWLALDYDCLAFALRTDSEFIKRVLHDFNLFEVDSRIKKFHSNSVLARLRARKGKSELARQSAIKRWNKPNSDDANALQTQSDGNAIKESKVKNSKVKENKVQIIATPGVAEVMNAFYEINPGLNFGNKTQRSTCEWLLEKYGLEKTLATIEYVKTIQTEKYAPTITTPQQLKEKMGSLIAYHQKKSSNPLIVSI